MTDENDTRAVVVAREFPHPPEKLWRALTEPHLVAEWLMQGDIRPEVGHRFAFGAQWGKVECEVRLVEPMRRIAYSWGDSRLKSVVTWTLEATAGGTKLTMEQVGFRADQPRYFEGAAAGWPKFLDRLDALLGRLG